MKQLAAKQVQAHLQSLAREQGGLLTANYVVECARDPKSPLHDRFEWDDSKAAHQHRLAQARQLIRSVHVRAVVDNRALTIPLFVHNPDDARQQGYVETTSLLNERDRAYEVIKTEVARAVSALRRADVVASVLDMETELEQLLAGFDIFLAKVEKKYAA